MTNYRTVLGRILLLPLAFGTGYVQTNAAPTNHTDLVSVAMSYLAPSHPLQDGAGLMVIYGHSFMNAGRPPSALAQSGLVRHVAVLNAAIGYFSIPSDADGTVMEGELTLWYPSVGLSESWFLKDGKWILSAGGGLSWYFPKAKGEFSVDAPIGISNEFDVDPGPGVYIEGGLERSIGSSGWEFVFDFGYLAAKLDGEHRFVISGVSGIAEDADFDLSGFQGSIGLAYRF